MSAGSQQQVTAHPCLLVFTVKVKTCKSLPAQSHQVWCAFHTKAVASGRPTLPLMLNVFHSALCAVFPHLLQGLPESS